QDQQRHRTEDAEGRLAGLLRRQQPGGEPPDPPEILVEQSRKPKTPGYPPGKDDDLESVPDHDDDNGHACEERRGGSQHVRNSTCWRAVLSCDRCRQACSLALTESSALNSFDTGHPVSAAFTAASNLARSAPGMVATRSRWLLVMEKLSPTFSRVMVA